MHSCACVSHVILTQVRISCHRLMRLWPEMPACAGMTWFTWPAPSLTLPLAGGGQEGIINRVRASFLEGKERGDHFVSVFFSALASPSPRVTPLNMLSSGE